MTKPKVETNIVEEIIIAQTPRGRKPKLQKVVEKALLLRELSDTALTGILPIVAAEVIVEKKVKQEPLAADVVVEPKFLDLAETILNVPNKVKIPRVRKVESQPTPTPPPTPTPTPEVIVKQIYHCSLCDVKFTSTILFERHPRTIRHKMNEQRANS